MIVFNNAGLGRVLAENAGTSYNAEVDTCIARVEDGELWGGVVYQNFTGASIAVHVASFRVNWINKDMLWVCFHYPFVQLGVKKMFGQVPASNCNALEFDLKLGFKEEARIKDVFPDGDLIVVSMRREDCRWLKVRPTGLTEPVNGWKEQGTAAS
jgi:RimJ/RimL family protein N-acetyltransferase